MENNNFNPYKLFLECMLDSYKKDFNELNYSLVFNVEDSIRMNIFITDITEHKPYCGISAVELSAVVDFLNRKIEKIKSIPA